MGIQDLWAYLKDAFEPRVSFQVFVTQFAQLHHRTPRVSIDANIMLHHSVGYDSSDEAQIRTFMSKLMYLMSLNVSFVVVLDGRFKPTKLRNTYLGYQDDTDHFCWDHPYSSYSEGLSIVERLKKILLSYKIDFIQAPAEAEAECVMLQRYGVVDYVITDDSDAFVFGATAVLKSFKKDLNSPSKASLSDRSPSPISSAFNRDYFVTPVHMSSIEEKLGLTNHMLVLVANLRGGDYSSGIDKVGIVRAIQIAQCGTPFGVFATKRPLKSPKKKKKIVESTVPLPNFTKIFIDSFVDRSKKFPVFDHYGNPLPKISRELLLKKFLALLNQKIKERPIDIFGEQRTYVNDFFIEEKFVLLYLFPYVSDKIYKFLPGSSSFGELRVVQLDLTIPSNNTINIDVSKEEVVPRMNSVRGGIEHFIGDLYITYTDVSTSSIFFLKFSPTNEEIIIRSSSLSMPDNCTQNVKNLLLKIITHFDTQPELKELIKITRLKMSNDIELLMLKYPKNLKRKVFKKSDENWDSDDSEEGPDDSVWFPRTLVEMANESLVSDFKQQEKLSKKEVAPSTTLDFFGIFPASPKKRMSVTLPENGRPVTSPRGRSTTTRNRRKSPLKNKILPGQSLVTSFFANSPTKSKEPCDPLVESPKAFINPLDPFIEVASDDLIIEILAPSSYKVPESDPPVKDKEPLFIELDSDDSDIDMVADLISESSYTKLRGFIRLAPILSNPPSLTQSNSFDISPGSSPTKRKRISSHNDNKTYLESAKSSDRV